MRHDRCLKNDFLAKNSRLKHNQPEHNSSAYYVDVVLQVFTPIINGLVSVWLQLLQKVKTAATSPETYAETAIKANPKRKRSQKAPVRQWPTATTPSWQKNNTKYTAYGREPESSIQWETRHRWMLRQDRARWQSTIEYSNRLSFTIANDVGRHDEAGKWQRKYAAHINNWWLQNTLCYTFANSEELHEAAYSLC